MDLNDLSFSTIFFLISISNVLLWYFIGRHTSLRNQESCISVMDKLSNKCYVSSSGCSFHMEQSHGLFRPILSKALMQYKEGSLVNIKYPEWSILMQQSHKTSCKTIVNPHATIRKDYLCFAVVRAEVDFTFNLLRFESDHPALKTKESKQLVKKIRKDRNQRKKEENQINQLNDTKPDGLLANTSGFFNNVANDNGRIKLAENMIKLLSNLEDLERMIENSLEERNIKKRDNVVVMVLNTGEIDLFLNFACSCFFHNISLHNVLVFSGSGDVIPLINNVGAIGIYHETSFTEVSKKANFEYLDPIFIDMMWYKSFSVWLLLKLNYNVLFQDVDIIWFQQPFSYFSEILKTRKKEFKNMKKHAEDLKNQNKVVKLANLFLDNFLHRQKRGDDDDNEHLQTPSGKNKYFIDVDVDADRFEVDAYLSDDGQRSLRYTPFFANSGFYYLKANPRMEYFAWTVLTAFAVLHISGSHQNVFTLRLQEGLDLAALRPHLLSLGAFPSGVKYNHDKPFMRLIRDRHIKPIMFHMCWTANKYGKLRNFREVRMWFLDEAHSAALGLMGLPRPFRPAAVVELFSVADSRNKRRLNALNFSENENMGSTDRRVLLYDEEETENDDVKTENEMEETETEENENEESEAGKLIEEKRTSSRKKRKSLQTFNEFLRNYEQKKRNKLNPETENETENQQKTEFFSQNENMDSSTPIPKIDENDLKAAVSLSEHLLQVAIRGNNLWKKMKNENPQKMKEKEVHRLQYSDIANMVCLHPNLS